MGFETPVHVLFVSLNLQQRCTMSNISLMNYIHPLHHSMLQTERKSEQMETYVLRGPRMTTHDGAI